jgi:hypothetical protein
VTAAWLSPTATAAAIATARQARDDAMATAELSEKAQLDKALIDDLIAAFAGSARPFSANDLRFHLPADVNQNLIGNRFTHAAKNGVIRRVGLTPSTKRTTHLKDVACWIGATP